MNWTLRRRSPADRFIRRAAQGLVAGLVGSVTMTGWQELSSKLQSSDPAQPDSEDRDPWDQAPVPAKVARRVSRVVGWDPPAQRIGLLTNVMHYGYGTGWGVVYSTLTRQASGTLTPLRGVLFGTAVWLCSYAQLVPMGLYDPPWEYSPTELALDLSYHLVYGVGTAVSFTALDHVT